MSGRLALYRTTVNLRGLGVGAEIEIDPTDPGWAGDIAAKRIVPANVATSESYLTDDAGPAPDEWVEDWDSGAIVDLRAENGEGDDGARWPIPAPRGGFVKQGDWSGS